MSGQFCTLAMFHVANFLMHLVTVALGGAKYLEF